MMFVLLAALFATMGAAHATHAHPADQASTVHPVCTICQFHAPAATVGDVQAHVDGPGPGHPVACAAPDLAPLAAHARVHASRAPPSFLAA